MWTGSAPPHGSGTSSSSRGSPSTPPSGSRREDPMINTAGKFAFVLTVIGFALAIGYGIAVGDRAGTLLFVALGIASLVLGLSLSGSGALDRAPWVDPESPIADVPVGRSAATRPSWWPLALAAAGTVGVAGLAVGAAMIYV